MNIEEINIKGAKIRRAITGTYIFKIPGANSQKKTDKLTLGMKKALAGKVRVRIQRPTKMAELRLREIDESIETPEIVKAVAYAKRRRSIWGR